MIRYWVYIFLFWFYNGISQNNQSNKDIPILTFNELAPQLQTQSDTLFIVNFWATWCAPCIKELPFFEKLNSDFKDKKVKILLISLDFKSQIETTLKNFIKKNKIQSQVIVLADKKMDDWIPKVSPKWEGSIPATLMFTKNNRFFAETEYENYQDLLKQVKRMVNDER